MWIVEASNLSPSDLALLGNNFRPPVRRHSARHNRHRDNRRLIAAVNRSLASLRERVARLYPRRMGGGMKGRAGGGQNGVRVPTH